MIVTLIMTTMLKTNLKLNLKDTFLVQNVHHPEGFKNHSPILGRINEVSLNRTKNLQDTKKR